MSEEQEPFDEEGPAADPVKVRDATRRKRDIQRQRGDVLRQLVSTEAGREFVAYILHEVCGLYRPTANAAFDANSLYYREGARAVGLVLMEMLVREAKPQYMALVSENIHNR